MRIKAWYYSSFRVGFCVTHIESACKGTGADSGGEASGGPTMHSNYFLCNPASPTHPLHNPTTDESQASNVTSATVDDAPPDVQSIVVEKVANPVEKKESKKSEELDISGPGAKSGSCGSQMHELAGMDWMEPMPPGMVLTIPYMRFHKLKIVVYVIVMQRFIIFLGFDGGFDDNRVVL